MNKISKGDESALDYLYKKYYRMMTNLVIKNNATVYLLMLKGVDVAMLGLLTHLVFLNQVVLKHSLLVFVSHSL